MSEGRLEPSPEDTMNGRRTSELRTVMLGRRGDDDEEFEDLEEFNEDDEFEDEDLDDEEYDEELDEDEEEGDDFEELDEEFDDDDIVPRRGGGRPRREWTDN
jgi:hypothetical protein